MVEITNAQGQVIRRSQNLRGIFAHARRTWIEEAVACPVQEGRGLLQVTFGDSCTCRTEFASYQVLCDWLRNRGTWAGVRKIGDSAPF